MNKEVEIEKAIDASDYGKNEKPLRFAVKF